MEIKYRPLKDLHPNPKNPRKGSEDAIAQLAQSIKANPAFFEARPILLSDRTGRLVIIGGERRSEAAAMPFFGKYVFAYIPHPKGKILGLSKIGRVVDYHSARLQVQERLVADIVDDIEHALGTEYPPLGIALIMQGEHLCKTMRGVKKQGLMSACKLVGEFRDNSAVRSEFMRTAERLLK